MKLVGKFDELVGKFDELVDKFDKLIGKFDKWFDEKVSKSYSDFCAVENYEFNYCSLI